MTLLICTTLSRWMDGWTERQKMDTRALRCRQGQIYDQIERLEMKILYAPGGRWVLSRTDVECQRAWRVRLDEIWRECSLYNVEATQRMDHGWPCRTGTRSWRPKPRRSHGRIGEDEPIVRQGTSGVSKDAPEISNPTSVRQWWDVHKRTTKTVKAVWYGAQYTSDSKAIIQEKRKRRPQLRVC